MNSLVAFKQGTQAQYDALSEKDVDTLYFCKDTQRIYKGSVEYTKSSKIVSSVPSVSEGVYGTVYVVTSDMIPRVFNGTEYVKLIKSYETSISDSTSSDNSVPTTKAVKEYVDNSKTNSITNVEFQNSTGALNLFKNNASSASSEVQLSGVAHDPSYVQSSRKITIPIYGSEDLVIELGVDAFVESGSYNSETKSIDLILTNGQTVSVPATDLVKEYKAGNTSSISMSLSEDNTFTGTIKISNSEGNTLVLNEDGLFVPPGEGTQIVWTDISST